MAHRYTYMLLAFILGVAGVLYLALFELQVKFEDSQKIEDALAQSNEVSHMEDVQYYKLGENGPELELNAFYLKMQGKNKMEFNLPDGIYYSSQDRTLKYRAASANYSGKKNIIEMIGDVQVETLDSVIKSKNAVYDIGKERVDLDGNVISKTFDRVNGDSVVITSSEAVGFPKENRLAYKGQVRGEVKRKRVFEGGVSFGSEELKMDLNQSQIDLIGDVVFEKQQVKATSRRGQIFLQNYNKKLKYYALFDDVKVVEKLPPSAGVDERKAFSEVLEGHVREKKLVLSGSPKVIQGENIIQGNLITLFEKTQVVEVDDAATNLKFEKILKD